MQRLAALCFLLVVAALVQSGSAQGPQQPLPRPFPELPKPGFQPASLQSLVAEAPSGGLAPAALPSQAAVEPPAPWGVGTPYQPQLAPAPALPPRSPYDPIFNPIISKVPVVSAQDQSSLASTQTVTVNSNGQISTSPTNYANGAGAASNYGANNAQLNGATGQQTQGSAGTSYQNQLPAVAAPSTAELAATNPMVHAVDLAQQSSQTTPQLSFGQDGMTVQQPVVSHPQDGVTSGGNQLKVNEYGVILGNVGTGGSVLLANNGGVTIDPGTAGNLWNLARQAATLYGRKMKL